MKKTMKLLGMISMVVICAAACGTQEPQEETKAVQSGQDEENQNQVKFSVENASFYQNEIYFEIAAENVVLKEMITWVWRFWSKMKSRGKARYMV